MELIWSFVFRTNGITVISDQGKSVRIIIPDRFVIIKISSGSSVQTHNLRRRRFGWCFVVAVVYYLVHRNSLKLKSISIFSSKKVEDIAFGLNLFQFRKHSSRTKPIIVVKLNWINRGNETDQMAWYRCGDTRTTNRQVENWGKLFIVNGNILPVRRASPKLASCADRNEQIHSGCSFHFIAIAHCTLYTVDSHQIRDAAAVIAPPSPHHKLDKNKKYISTLCVQVRHTITPTPIPIAHTSFVKFEMNTQTQTQAHTADANMKNCTQLITIKCSNMLLGLRK